MLEKEDKYGGRKMRREEEMGRDREGSINSKGRPCCAKSWRVKCWLPEDGSYRNEL